MLTAKIVLTVCAATATAAYSTLPSFLSTQPTSEVQQEDHLLLTHTFETKFDSMVESFFARNEDAMDELALCLQQSEVAALDDNVGVYTDKMVLAEDLYEKELTREQRTTVREVVARVYGLTYIDDGSGRGDLALVASCTSGVCSGGSSCAASGNKTCKCKCNVFGHAVCRCR